MSYFDDIEIGAVAELGTYHFEREAILAFARRFDPQPFHLDEEAARASVFGALCASGWHTASAFMRLNVEHGRRESERRRAAGLSEPRFGPSPGVTELRWLRPVFAGDTIGYRQRIEEKRRSASRAGWGLVSTRAEAANASGELVMTLRARVFVGTD